MAAAFALTVLDFDHDTISALYDELQSRGLAVTVTAVSQDEATGTPSTIAAPAVDGAAGAAAAPSSSSTGESEKAAFKCPACGATYAEQGVCANRHDAVPTLPTEDVLAGAAPDAAKPDEAAQKEPGGGAGGASGEAAASGGATGGAAAAPADPSDAGPDWPQ